MTDADFLAWLKSPSAIRIVLVEAVASVSGVETTRYMATGGYVTSATDTPANTVYEPIIEQGLTFTEQLSLTGDASLSVGDIEIANYAGERDDWLDDIWDNRSIQVFIGDPRWARDDFRTIFNGTIKTLSSKDRNTLNLVMCDKLQLLNTPVIDTVLGGSTSNQNALIPVAFGEVHNITPLLSDPATLEYTVHDAEIESIIEVRDNGVPVSFTADLANGKFTLDQQSYGTITGSVQGDKPSTYSNTISQLVQRLVTGYGTAANRFTSGDLDADNLSDFDTACPQPVGIYMSSRTNVLKACRDLADSVGAQLSMSREGKLRLIQLQLPGTGTPVEVGESQIVEKSLRIISRPPVTGSIVLGFNKNWTVQNGLLSAIPEEHRVLYETQWLTATADDSTVNTNYKLNSAPVQKDTMLLTRTDAEAEALRLLNLWKVQRTVFQFEGTADLLHTLELGCAITLTNYRFGLSEGQTGIVISLAPNWLNGRVTVGVLI